MWLCSVRARCFGPMCCFGPDTTCESEESHRPPRDCSVEHHCVRPARPPDRSNLAPLVALAGFGLSAGSTLGPHRGCLVLQRPIQAFEDFCTYRWFASSHDRLAICSSIGIDHHHTHK